MGCDDRLTWFLCGWGSRNVVGFKMPAADRMVLVLASKLTWHCLGGRYRLDFGVEDPTWHYLS